MDIKWGNDSLFNSWCWQNWTGTCKRMKLDYCLTPYTKINLKWIKDLNVSHETIGKHLLNISMSNFFLNTSPQARETKAKMNKWDYIKLKASVQQRTLSIEQKASYNKGEYIHKSLI